MTRSDRPNLNFDQQGVGPTSTGHSARPRLLAFVVMRFFVPHQPDRQIVRTRLLDT